MKKIFLIFGIMGGLFINNANAVQSDTVVVQYVCPSGCELYFFRAANGNTTALCRKTDGTSCEDPQVVIRAVAPNGNLQVSPVSKTNKVREKKKTVSARSAETPKMVKKIVYEQVVEDEDFEM